MTTAQYSLVFVDSNVLVEAVFLPDSAAAAIVELAANRTLKMRTCRAVITDVENAILKKLQKTPERLSKIIDRWKRILDASQIDVSDDPEDYIVESTYELYMAAMRHEADIQILAAALQAKPDVILSGNREHFNDIVSKKCGIPILSCSELINMLGQAKG